MHMQDNSDPWKALGKAAVHVVAGSLLFVIIAVTAVGIDLLVAELPKIGVGFRAVQLLQFAALAVLAVDLLLLVSFVVRTGWQFLKSL